MSIRRAASSHVVIVIAAASFLWLAVASAGHLHAGTTTDALKTECQLCTIGHARFDRDSTVPSVLGFGVLAWAIFLSPAAAPRRHAPVLPSPRAPPSR